MVPQLMLKLSIIPSLVIYKYPAIVTRILCETLPIPPPLSLPPPPPPPSPPRTNMVMNYSDVESKVREATNDETWGPHGSLMSEIAKFTYTYEHYPEVMTMLWRRMFDAKKNWRRTYKVRELAEQRSVH